MAGYDSLPANANVLQYEYESPDRTMSARQVKETVVMLRADFQTACQDLYRATGAMPTEEQVRRRLTESSEAYALFSRPNDHPKMFEAMTSYGLTKTKYDITLEMIDIQDMKDRGLISAAAAEQRIIEFIKRAGTSTPREEVPGDP